MYLIEVTFGQYSSTSSCKPTVEDACKEIEYLYTYYKPLHDNTKVSTFQLCDACSQGKIKRCPAPKRHSNGYHGERCYKLCKVCKGNYSTPIEL